MGELLALRWRDVDFGGSAIRVRASYAGGALTTPKSGKVRAVPMAPDVAAALARLGRRADWVGDDDLVFVGETGGYLDGSALRRRYKDALSRAALRPLRFHDLRYTFGTRMIANIVPPCRDDREDRANFSCQPKREVSSMARSSQSRRLEVVSAIAPTVERWLHSAPWVAYVLAVRW